MVLLLSLKHQLRANVSFAALPSDLRDMLQRRLGDLERQLLTKVAELENEKSLLHNETSTHRQRTEAALNALLERVSELERGNGGHHGLLVCVCVLFARMSFRCPCVFLMESWCLSRLATQSSLSSGAYLSGYSGFDYSEALGFLSPNVLSPLAMLAVTSRR